MTIQGIYYHVFGTATERFFAMNGQGSAPIFWRTNTPISWDSSPILTIAGGLDQFDQYWNVKTKYGEQMDIFPITESRYNSRFTGRNDFGFGLSALNRLAAFFFVQGSFAGNGKGAYDVVITDVVRVTDENMPSNPYPVNFPEFPTIPDKDFQVEIQFSNLEYDNTRSAEQRIVEWADPIRIFNLSRTTLDSNSLDILLDFHENRLGTKGDFLYRDISDYQATKDPKDLGNGASTQGTLYPDADGTRTEFILTKSYSCGDNTHYRPIIFPDIPTVKIYQGGIEATGYIVAPDRVVFNSPPSAGLLTWEGDFKTLCHFEEDRLDYQPVVKVINGTPTPVKGIFSVPKFVLRESRLPFLGVTPVDVFNSTLNHDFLLNLTKRSTISPQFQSNILELSSGERKRYSRRGNADDTNSLQPRKTLYQKDIEYLVCLWLSAKGSGATFLYPDLISGGSNLSRFNSKSLSYSNQAVQRIYSLGDLQIKRFLDGILTDVGTGGDLSAPMLTLCRCILIELTDGEKLGYTSFSRDLTIDGVVFRSRQAFDLTALDRKIGLEADNEELRGGFSDDIDENLVLSARFQEAKITTAVVNWQDIPNSLLDLDDEQVQVGFVGEITSKSGETYTLENLTEASTRLKQSRDEKVSPSCRWSFGQDNGDGTGCQVTLLSYPTQVALVGDRRVFEVWGVLPNNLRWGKCTFTDGRNRRASYPIYQTTSFPFAGRTLVELFVGAADTIAVHDAMILTAGCGRTYEDCKTLWNNTQNFGGIPSFGNFMPGNDFIFSSPRQ